MSNIRIAETFKEAPGKKAFIPFVTAGDPNLATTAELVRALVRAGADIIELGIPFSDPTAEGPVIQDANIRSLSAGTTTDSVFQLVEALRSGKATGQGAQAIPAGEPVTIPLLAMTYANVVFHYGTERFCARAAEVGLDGIILPDVSFEEHDEFADVCAAHNLAYISLIAPTSQERIAAIASEAEGFIYLVSSLGVTGTRSEITTDLGEIVKKIREVSTTPIAIGFGISNPEQARSMAALSDGAIMGSALVRIVAEHGEDAVLQVEAFARSVAEAVHEG